MYNNLVKIHDLTCMNFDYKNNFINFFNTEINKICRFNEDNQFIMDGKFKSSHVENMFDNYINIYKKCPICKSINTLLKRENRLTKLKCNTCTTENTVKN
jgi:translation initiation factor 2 subunit 2